MFDLRAVSQSGSFVLLGILLVAFPRFATVIAGGAALGIALMLHVRRRLGVAALRDWLLAPACRSLLVPLAAFCVWSLLASAWAQSPIGGLGKSLLTIAVVGAAFLVAHAVGRVDRDLAERAVTGLALGIAVAGVYLVFETLTDRSLASYLFKHFPMLQSGYEKHLRITRSGIVHVSDANLNRSTGVYCLLLWPAILVGLRRFSGWPRVVLTGGLALSGMLILACSRHQTSQLALAASLVAFGLASLWPGATRRLVSGALIGILLLIVPASVAAYELGLAEAPWLFSTARKRVEIWNHTAQQILKQPVIGVGTDSTHKLSDDFKQSHVPVSKTAPPPQWRPHPHNVYLQVWSELGAIGAVLLGWAGLAGIWISRWLPRNLEPFPLAQAAMTFGLISSSYGLWQTWFQAAIAIGALALYAATRPPTGCAAKAS